MNNTKTTGFPVFNSSFNKRCCTSGIPISVRLLDSPLYSEDSPKAATITSAFLAIAKASFLNSSSLRLSRPKERPNIVALSSIAGSVVRLLPFAYTTLVLFPATDFKPSTNVLGLLRSTATLHVPGIFSPELANGPTTAIVPCFFNGKV